MSGSEFVENVKNWLRISTHSVDEEIEQVIEACLIDLQNSGVKNPNLEDRLIQQAVKLYAKAQFGYDSNASKFYDSYEYLKISLALSGEYNGGN